MRNNSGTTAFAIGMAGAMMGACVYQMMTPKYQKQIKKTMKHAASELGEMASDLGDDIHDMTRRY